ncbi:hypothetical protein PT974_05847 [Cladobotryum mycophilum]|uniref:Uncharacterized protein n=1 Tax=Cladobotryum mycophilum TaxID=491253 RepID=A0ABR0SJX1_9HYPO
MAGDGLPQVPSWVRHMRMFEYLLCRRVCRARPMDYTQEYIVLIHDLVGAFDSDHWSLQSFLHDMRSAYTILGIEDIDPTDPRPSNDLMPRIPKYKVDALKSVPAYRDNEPFGYMLRLADQLYNMVRTEVKLPYKYIAEVVKELGLHPLHLTESEKHLMSATTKEARRTYLEDRVEVLERREEMMAYQVQRATETISLYSETNQELARRLAERWRKLTDDTEKK